MKIDRVFHFENRIAKASHDLFIVKHAFNIYELWYEQNVVDDLLLEALALDGEVNVGVELAGVAALSSSCLELLVVVDLYLENIAHVEVLSKV